MHPTLAGLVLTYVQRVLFRRGSLRNGYHIQGRQQARKLPNPNTGRYVEALDLCFGPLLTVPQVVTINTDTGLFWVL